MNSSTADKIQKATNHVIVLNIVIAFIAIIGSMLTGKTLTTLLVVVAILCAITFTISAIGFTSSLITAQKEKAARLQ